MNCPSEQLHDKVREYLQLHPEVIIINKNGDHQLTNIIASGEMSLFDPDKKTEIGRPDLVMIDRYGQFYLVELQPTGSHKQRAIHQLDRAENHIAKYLETIPYKLYVTGSPNRGFKTYTII